MDRHNVPLQLNSETSITWNTHEEPKQKISLKGYCDFERVAIEILVLPHMVCHEDLDAQGYGRKILIRCSEG
jgi:hypothetical protein